jgi:phage shock protein C
MAGKKPGKTDFERGIENFTEEMGEIGNRIGKHFEHRHKHEHPHGGLGILGPFLSSVVGIIFLGILIWIIDFVNARIGSVFLGALNSFFLNNMGLLFLFSIFFSYSSYFSKVSRRGYEMIVPVFAAAGIAIAFWIAGNIVSIVNLSLGISALSTVAFFMINGAGWIFGFVVFVGYLALAVRLVTEKPVETRRTSMKEERPKVKRLYRSGKERILGGVCGGIAEYLDVDPVLIRLIWVAGALTFGTGILLYIIAWIIIPRNPNHKW